MSVTDSAGMKNRQCHLQFFVRTVEMGRSKVMTGFPEETVKSVLERMAWATRIPIKEQRVIYNGKQLQLDKTLEECGIQNDSSLYIVGHLRSVLYPAAWRIVNYMVAMLAHVSGGCGSTCSTHHTCEVLNKVKILTFRHFNLAGFTEAFAASKGPFFLVSLYANLDNMCNRKLAEVCIDDFIRCSRAAMSQSAATGAVLEFCKELRKSGCGSDDPLYVSCRSTLGFLLETIGVKYGSGSVKQKVPLRDLFSFVPELADRLMIGLDYSIGSASTSQRSSIPEVSDFAKFITPIRTRLLFQQQGLGGFVCENVKCSVEKEDQLLEEEVDYLRLVFVRLLSKMDDCLGVMELCLAGKEPGKSGFVLYPAWSGYLGVLKELYETSKVFDGAEEVFRTSMKHHKNMLWALVVAFAKRGTDHRWILEDRTLTNFECRRHLAMMLFPEVKEEYDLFHEMLIDRSKLLTESFEYIGRAKPESLLSGLFMEFKNEEATGPGVLREWFVLVCRAIFDPKNGLFVACPNDCRRFYPSPASKVHPRHLEYFRFSGRVIALALMKNVQVGIVFDRVFFMQLAGNNVTLEDIRDADPYLYRSCKQILEMDADFIDSDALGLTFVREVDELGCRKVVELCPGGKSIALNSKNREKYVDLLIQNYFVTSISEQVSHFAKGFGDILSYPKLRQFFQGLDLQDLDWMLHGSENDISIEDWKAHTEYKGYKETDTQISWFWEIVGRMSAQQKKALIFFWTSVKYLPFEGFRGLSSRLYIYRTVEPNNHLPSSHTCFYQLCFPRYASMAVMQDRFEVITREDIGCSFGTY